MMEWIKIIDEKPEINSWVLVCDEEGFICIAQLEDRNELGRERARTRKDKWPVAIRWQEMSSCCYGEENYIEEYPYWMPLPKPVIKS